MENELKTIFERKKYDFPKRRGIGDSWALKC